MEVQKVGCLHEWDTTGLLHNQGQNITRCMRLHYNGKGQGQVLMLTVWGITRYARNTIRGNKGSVLDEV